MSRVPHFVPRLTALDDRLVPSFPVSVVTASDGRPVGGNAPAVSGTGRYVAFETGLSLVSADANGFYTPDVYLKDRATGSVRLISAGAEGSAVGGSNAAVTADGRYVVYQSKSDSVAGGSPFTSDIFRLDTVTGQTALVSAGESWDCVAPSVSDDGTVVVYLRRFATTSYTFHPVWNVPSGETLVHEVVVRDLADGGAATTVSPPAQDDNRTSMFHFPISVPPDRGYRNSFAARVSGDGSTVVFASTARAAGGSWAADATSLHLVDLPTRGVTRLPIGAQNETALTSVAVSRDGRLVAFDSWSSALPGGNGNTTSDVFVWDVASGAVEIASAANGQAGNGESRAPSLSGDGRYVAFTSLATNLTAGDTGAADVFVKDRATGIVTRVSRAVGDGPLDGDTADPALSGNGRLVAFASWATNLVSDDTNGLTDLFLAEVPAGGGLMAVAAGAGGSPRVRAYTADGAERFNFQAYPAAYTGGVFVATGDVTGDGVRDIVTSTGKGGAANIRVFDGQTGALANSFFGYPEAFTGGVNVAAGDVNGDGYADVVCGVGVGGGPNVRVFSGADGELLTSFFAYAASFTGGVRVSAADINADGYADIVCAVGSGGGPNVRVYDGKTGALLSSFFAYPAAFTGGLFVAAGDVTGDGVAEVVTGVETGGGPNVRALDARTGSVVRSFFAFDGGQTGGVRVAAADTNGDGFDDFLAGTGPGTNGQAVVLSGLDGTTPLRSPFAPFGGFAGGVNVG